MEHVIEKLLENFEKGKMNRRQLVRSLAVAASAASVGASIEAFAAEGPLPVSLSAPMVLHARVCGRVGRCPD